jgi:hypothetical protein
MKRFQMPLRWLEDVDGLTVAQILDREGQYRPDSLVAAIYRALQHKQASAGDAALSADERSALRVLEMYAAVDNLGHYAFFYNATAQELRDLLPAISAVGCPDAADNAARALAAIGFAPERPELDDAWLDRTLGSEDGQRDATLERCDSAFYGHCSQLEQAVLAYVRRHLSAFDAFIEAP